MADMLHEAKSIQHSGGGVGYMPFVSLPAWIYAFVMRPAHSGLLWVGYYGWGKFCSLTGHSC